MANKTNKQKETVKAKRDYFTQVKGTLRMIVIIAEVYAAATLLLVVDADLFMKVASAVLATDALVELIKRFSK